MCFHSLLTLVTSVLVAARPFQGYLTLTSSTPVTVEEKITAWRSEIDTVHGCSGQTEAVQERS